VLGRYWPTASEDERTQFIVAFENHLVHAYAMRLGAYSGEKFRVLAPRAESATVTIVPVEILRATSRRGQIGPPATFSQLAVSRRAIR
jgi:ABC-type transporter MlaC component